MLEKHNIATTSHCQHQNFNSSSSEPRLKIKISRLKDGSASFFLHKGFNNPDDSVDVKSQSHNEEYDVSQGDEYDDGEETEEEDFDLSEYPSLNHTPKRTRLDIQEDAVQPSQNGHHNKTYDIKIADKSSDKENQMALRTRNSRSKAAEELPVDLKFKTCSKKITSSKKSVGCSTEVDLLGPCQPGTHIKLPGLVWSESSENGMLLFKTVWKDKPFVGMLMEAGEGDDWSVSKSRVYASCPGSRYKRKCKKPREFRYVNCWQKKNNKTLKLKPGMSSSMNDSDVDSNNEDEVSYVPDSNDYLPCYDKGCGKKFVNEVARGYHFSHAHSSMFDKEEAILSNPRQHRLNGRSLGNFSRHSFKRHLRDGICHSVDGKATMMKSKIAQRKRKLNQSLDDTAHDSSLSIVSNDISTQHNLTWNGHYPPIKDISGDDDDRGIKNSHLLGTASDMFYTSSLNPTSLVIRRALKTYNNDAKICINDNETEKPRPNTTIEADSLPCKPRAIECNIDDTVITSSGLTFPLASSNFVRHSSPVMDFTPICASPPRTLSQYPVCVEPHQFPPVSASSWLDHYPHSISAALTMSLLSRSKIHSNSKLRDFSSDDDEQTIKHVTSENQDSFEEVSKHSFDDSPATITSEICEVPTSRSPVLADITPTSNGFDPTGFISQGENVPQMDLRAFQKIDGASDMTDDQKPNCVSPIYSDISDTVDQAPLFANTSIVLEPISPEVNELWSELASPPYSSNQYDKLPQLIGGQSKVADWLNCSEENGDGGPNFDNSGYTSYLQQILCNKEKFYMSLALSSPSNSPRRTNPSQENHSACEITCARECFVSPRSPDQDGAT